METAYVSWCTIIGPDTSSCCPMTGRHLFAGATLKYSLLFLLHKVFRRYLARTRSALESTAKLTKMQVLGVVAVVLALYCVHANVYFREEFLDGGKFGLDVSDSNACCLEG